jgi:hypothetical protein
MATAIGPSGGVLGEGLGGDGMLPATGFGPGSIVIALIGGILTFIGTITHRLGRRPASSDS